MMESTYTAGAGSDFHLLLIKYINFSTIFTKQKCTDSIDSKCHKNISQQNKNQNFAELKTNKTKLIIEQN